MLRTKEGEAKNVGSESEKKRKKRDGGTGVLSKNKMPSRGRLLFGQANSHLISVVTAAGTDRISFLSFTHGLAS
jgi:hypothetical protein